MLLYHFYMKFCYNYNSLSFINTLKILKRYHIFISLSC